VYSSNLGPHLEEARLISDPARRGRELERVTAQVFRREHFRVQLNPGTARPRQTDLIAIRSTDICLVEFKWRSDPVNIDDIDSLRSRLRRTVTHATGVMLSFHGFTEPARVEVLVNRAQPILLISGDELEKVAAERISLSDLLWRKRQALTVDGEVSLDEPARRTRKSLVRLPRTRREFLWPDGTRTTSVECGGGFGQFAFTQGLVDIDWASASGVGVTLDISPWVGNAGGLVGMLDHMANLGWVTDNACWSIQQTTRNWHGFGPAAFADALKHWRPRVRTERAHHSEEIFYTDACDGASIPLPPRLPPARAGPLLLPASPSNYKVSRLTQDPFWNYATRSGSTTACIYGHTAVSPSVAATSEGKQLA